MKDILDTMVDYLKKDEESSLERLMYLILDIIILLLAFVGFVVFIIIRTVPFS